MNNEPWFNLDSESACLHQEARKVEQSTGVSAFPEGIDSTEPEPQQSADYSDVDDGVVRFGNNRKKVKGLEAKARRKMAKKSKQKNRK